MKCKLTLLALVKNTETWATILKNIENMKVVKEELIKGGMA